MDIPCNGNKLSWCNGRRGGSRIWARLDRVMVNLMFSNLFGDVQLSYLPRTSSDHAPMLIIAIGRKLKVLKGALRKWNKETFGRVEDEIKKLEGRMIELELNITNSYSEQRENELINCKQDHLKWVHREEMLACQKSRIKWLTEGDANTKFFQASMRLKRKSKKIENMRLTDGTLLTSSDAVHEEVVRFFQELLMT
ncbi:uncharacterized protein LOC122277012 [Carya illinoinensis]|uniref:uncharacterized protein LOC122277012 n=1 Tax=Carya illinoinensis TaxID=32201 RepID=UPI001C719DC0|nr:uncharacterized protein LOC122277012 [Carya illinoinensis]